MYDITIEEVKKSGIIPDNNPLKYIGKNWLKDEITGLCYRIEKFDDGGLIVAETRKSKISHKQKMITILCEDCGAKRDVKTQDVFQVVRCESCQKKRRNVQRRERAKKARKGL